MRRDGEIILDPGIEFSPFVEKFISNHAWLNHIKPWLQTVFGSGFSGYLNNNYVWVDTTFWNRVLGHKEYTFGWAYKQNDYLNFAVCLGPLALGLIIWFLVYSMRIIGMRPMLICFMSIAFICFAQLTMFDPGWAGLCLAIGASCIAEGKRRKE